MQKEFPFKEQSCEIALLIKMQEPGQYYIAHFTCPTLLHYIDNISETISETPLHQILDLLLIHYQDISVTENTIYLHM